MRQHLSQLRSTMMIALLLFSAGAMAQSRVDTHKAIVAYVFPKNRVLGAGEIDARKLTRVNYAFANIQNGRIIDGFQNDAQNLSTLVALKQTNPSLAVLISVGGWEWSGNFSDMALTKSSRRTFIMSVEDYIRQNNIDGIDVDWEYPGQAGSTTHFRAQDRSNFTLLVRELRRSLNKEQRQLHRNLYLTIAAGASSAYLAHTQMAEVARCLDAVNIMAYDYYEPGEATGNHAPLFTDPADPKKVSADRSVREFIQAGVPPKKLVLGVPFYGHVWADVPDYNHGLYQSGSRPAQGYASYNIIAATMLDHGFERYWSPQSSVPYLYSPQTKIFVSYEDPESIAAKAHYVMGQDLAGIMFWDYDGDSNGILLNAVFTGLNESTAAVTQ